MAVTMQKAADLVAQYEHFFFTLKERAAAFSSQLATVSRSVEKDFETLHVALEQRKNVLLAEIQEEMSAPKDSDLSELSDRQDKMRSLLQQLQQLTVQGLLSEDAQCYRELLTEVNQAKQKLKETSDKYQLKFEGSLSPLVTKIASYGEIVSGLGGETPQTKADSQQAFTSLAQQFEAQCQLSNMLSHTNSKEVVSSSKHIPETGWLEYSKGCQWHRGVKYGRSPDGVPNFNVIFKKLKCNFARNSTRITKPYSMWLSKSNKPSTATQCITEPFNHIAGSHTSAWLQSSKTLAGSGGLSSWLHPSSISSSKGVCSVESVASTSVSSWLSPLSAKQSQDVKLHSECNTNELWLPSTTSPSEQEQPADVFNTIAATDASSWLSFTKESDVVHDKTLSSDNIVSWFHSPPTSGLNGGNPVEMFKAIADTSVSSWLSPSGSSEPAVMDTGSQSHSSNATEGIDALASSDASLWLHQTRDREYSDWMLCNDSSQDGVQWLAPRCSSPVCSETSTLLLSPGGDTGDDKLSDMFGSAHTLTSFGSSDFEVVDDTNL